MEIVPVHASLPVEIVRDLPLPQLLPISGSGHDSEEEDSVMVRWQQMIDFCSVYSALLRDVEALDISLTSKYTQEILRLVANLATCFGINTNPDGHQGTNDDHGNAAHMEFVHRLTKLAEATSKKSAFDIEPVDGLSGATIPDYLVALIAVRSPSLKSSLRSKLDTLGQYHAQFQKLEFTRAITNILNDSSEPPCALLGNKNRLQQLGLPKILFICIGPHMQEEKGQYVRLHIVACSAESFVDNAQTAWARSMHQKRMYYASAEGYHQVCAVECEFWMADEANDAKGKKKLGTSGKRMGDSETTRRANYVPYWQTMHHWPDAGGSPEDKGAASAGGAAQPGHIGVFNHADETAGAFDILNGFQRRARCFKCKSVYLYHQDAEFVRIEADMNGPHRTETKYKGVTKVKKPNDVVDTLYDVPEIGPSCAESLGHLLCSNKT